jgi:protein-L-isoaspartate(D-aspartate) O-methyltransferase
MVEQQVRTWEVLDQRVLDSIINIPREEFVPPAYRHLAFADISIPLDYNQFMMYPKVEGRLVQSLLLDSSDKVLEIGTGSGYLTALLARLANHVESVDIFEQFTKESETKLKRFNINNVSLATGNAVNGWKLGQQFDAILISGSLPTLLPLFKNQLAIGGRLIAIVGCDPVMEAVLITRVNEHEWLSDALFETSVPPLIGAPHSKRFVF